jgi:hypothetical protein
MTAYHRTSARAAEAILREGFADAEGTFGTGTVHRGVWVTLERPWDLAVAPVADDDPALLVIEVPDDAVADYEWIEEDKGYREALVPADVLNRHPVYRAWQCDECGAVAPERTPGWRSEVIETIFEPVCITTCSACRS